MKYSRLSPRKKERRKKKAILVFIFFVAVMVFSVFLIKHYDLKRNDVFSSTNFIKKEEEKPKRNNDLLVQKVNSLIAQYPNLEISVAFTDQDNDKVFTAGSPDPFIAASTAKVIVATDFLKQVEAGKYTLNQKISGVNASWHLRQMIQQSNNESWAAFNSLLGYSQETSFARANGLPSYNANQNTVKVSDEVRLWKKLYNREILNEEHTALLLSYMQGTNNEDMIPTALPESKVMHKYGTLYSNLHDVAIVEGKNTYFLGIFTDSKEPLYYERRLAVIRAIATEVNNFYNEN